MAITASAAGPSTSSAVRPFDPLAIASRASIAASTSSASDPTPTGGGATGAPAADERGYGHVRRPTHHPEGVGLADTDWTDMAITYEWRGAFANDEVNPLHAEAFGHRLLDDDWLGQVERWSLGWVTARDGDELVGFVNVPWDGGVHAFVLDTMVATDARHQGVGVGLVETAVAACRSRGGLEWLHVDFDEELTPFYEGACGFAPTPAGLIELS